MTKTKAEIFITGQRDEYAKADNPPQGLITPPEGTFKDLPLQGKKSLSGGDMTESLVEPVWMSQWESLVEPVWMGVDGPHHSSSQWESLVGPTKDDHCPLRGEI